MADVFTIAGLERATGVARSTIHFYVREGLLPQPQKTAASRALYGEDHVRLLRRINELKKDGLSLADIRVALETELAEVGKSGEDLAAKESERIRRAILRLATEEFATKGYKQTHVADIIRRLGITPQAFYTHFPSKSRLLAESFQTFISWNLAFVEPKLLESADLGERLLWRVFANFRANAFGSEVLALVRSEAPEDAETVRFVEKAWGGIVRRVMTDFEEVRTSCSAPPAVSLELLVYSLIGALHNAALRTSWDDAFGRVDLLRVHLWLYLAALAAWSGEIDIDSRVAGYEDLIRELAAREPVSPPPLEE